MRTGWFGSGEPLARRVAVNMTSRKGTRTSGCISPDVYTRLDFGKVAPAPSFALMVVGVTDRQREFSSVGGGLQHNERYQQYEKSRFHRTFLGWLWSVVTEACI